MTSKRGRLLRQELLTKGMLAKMPWLFERLLRRELSQRIRSNSQILLVFGTSRRCFRACTMRVCTMARTLSVTQTSVVGIVDGVVTHVVSTLYWPWMGAGHAAAA